MDGRTSLYKPENEKFLSTVLHCLTKPGGLECACGSFMLSATKVHNLDEMYVIICTLPKRISVTSHLEKLATKGKIHRSFLFQRVWHSETGKCLQAKKDL